jgi:pyridoxal/pyridoxine/pyridoxamine kinase
MLKRVQQLTLYSTGMATQLAQLRGALDGSSNGEGSGNAAPAAGDELCPGEQQQLLSRLASCQEQQRRLHQQLQQMASVLVPYTSRGSTTPASQAAVYSATTQLKQLHNQMHEQLQHLVQAIGDLATAVLTAVAAPKPDKPDELEASAAAADSVAKADWVAMLRSCLCAACDHLHRALELV